VRLAGRVDHIGIGGVGGLALVPAATGAEVELARHQRAGQVDIAGGVFAVGAVAFNAAADGGRAAPLVQLALGDHVDYPAHRIGTVQRGHRAANDLDAFDRVQRRDVVELVAAEAVGVDVAVVVLTAAVDQQQGVVAAHATHGHRALAGFVAGFADVHAFQVAHRIEQGDVRALGQLLGRDDRDRGRGIGDLLLEARCGHHHLVQGLGVAGQGGVSVRGQRCTDGTQQGQAQRGTEEGAAGTVAGSHGLFSADAAGGGRRLTIPADWALNERPFSNEVRASY